MSLTGANLSLKYGLVIQIVKEVGSKMASEVSLVERYKENPFIECMVVPVRGQKVQLSRLGRDDNVLVNQTTGEEMGTHVTTFRKVDAEQFVKLFTANIALTFGLNAAGIKAFNVLIWAVQYKAIGKDQIDLDSLALEDFLAAHEGNAPSVKLSYATFKRGLNELQKAQIIAKTLRAGRYFINPNFCFNGDRIAFTTLIERRKDPEELPKQI
ncbi:replication/maintenance protein RepL [Serratia sp. IR-2025]